MTGLNRENKSKKPNIMMNMTCKTMNGLPFLYIDYIFFHDTSAPFLSFFLSSYYYIFMICDFGSGRYVIYRGIFSFVGNSGTFIYTITNIMRISLWCIL